MTFKELEEALKIICFSYNSHNYFGGYTVRSEMKFEFNDYYNGETELLLYVEYTEFKDKLSLVRIKFFDNYSSLEKNEREERFKHCFSKIVKLLLFGKDELDIKNILAGTVNINWLHKNLPVIIPADRIKTYNPTAE